MRPGDQAGSLSPLPSIWGNSKSGSVSWSNPILAGPPELYYLARQRPASTGRCWWRVLQCVDANRNGRYHRNELEDEDALRYQSGAPGT